MPGGTERLLARCRGVAAGWRADGHQPVGSNRPGPVDELSDGKPVGALDEWHPGKGWSPVPGTEGMSGPNGVIVSPDGKTVFVAVWSGKQLVRVDLTSIPPKVDAVPTGFLTDNVRWSPDGRSIFAGGQDASVKQVLECFS